MWILLLGLLLVSNCLRVDLIEKKIPVLKDKRNLVQDSMTMEFSGNYWYYPVFLVPMEVGTNNQVLNFLLDPVYSYETTVILSTNSGNCSVTN